MRRWLRLVGLAAPCLVSAAQGQHAPRLTGSAEIGVNNRHLWRGVTRHHGLVAQGLGSVSLTGKALDATVTIWSSLVDGQCPACSAPDGVRLADVNGSASLAWHPTFIGLDVIAGFAHYSSRPAPWSLSEPTGSTSEVLLSLASRPSRHALLSFTGWMDVGKVKGTYFEVSATIPFTLDQGSNPRTYITGVLGINGAQAEGVGRSGYFADRGPAFGSLQVNWLPVWSSDVCKFRGSVQVFVRLQGNFDGRAKQVSPYSSKGREQQVTVGTLLRGSLGKVVPPEWCRTPGRLKRG